MVAHAKSVSNTRERVTTTVSTSTTKTETLRPSAEKAERQAGPSIHDLNHDFGTSQLKSGFGARLLEKINGVGAMCATPYLTAKYSIKELFNSKHLSAQARGAAHSFFSSYTNAISEKLQEHVAAQIEARNATHLKNITNHILKNVTPYALAKAHPELRSLSRAERRHFAFALRDEILSDYRKGVENLSDALKLDQEKGRHSGRARAEAALKWHNGLMQIEQNMIRNLQYKMDNAVALKKISDGKAAEAKIRPTLEVRREEERALKRSFRNNSEKDRSERPRIKSRAHSTSQPEHHRAPQSTRERAMAKQIREMGKEIAELKAQMQASLKQAPTIEWPKLNGATITNGNIQNGETVFEPGFRNRIANRLEKEGLSQSSGGGPVEDPDDLIRRKRRLTFSSN